MREGELGGVPVSRGSAFAIELTDWHELRSALLVAEAVTVAALAREESRGAHQRDDFPETSGQWRANQEIVERSDAIVSRFVPVAMEGCCGMSAIAVLRIARGEPGEPGRFDAFEVPYTPGQSVLDGLMWIREHADASLAFRFACINANVCKECVMRIDGKNRYACTERLKPGETVLEPLPNKRRIRDLACDTVPPKERLVRG